LGVDYRLAPFNATGNPNSVAITDPIFDCAGNSGTAIDVLPGANNTVIELNIIGGLTGPCAVAGVLVEADNNSGLGGLPGPGGQARFDADGDGLEDTTGTRIRANVFIAANGASGPAIFLEENVLGNPDPNVGALEDQPPFEQCTTAGTDTVHTVVGSTSANATITNDNPPADGIADYADVGRGGALTDPGPWSRNDGNQIFGTGGSWGGGIYSEGSHICIRGNLIGSSVTVTAGVGSNTATAGTIVGDGIRILPGGNGHAIWGNVIGGTAGGAAVAGVVTGNGIAILGPFKLTSVFPDGDSVYDNIIGNDDAFYSPDTVNVSGPSNDGVLCEDERIYVQGSSQGAQRVIGAGDDGFDMSNVDSDGEGFGCTKRDAVFNNDAINNANSGFELPFGDVVDNDAYNNGGDGFLGATVGFLCGNVAMSNGDSSGEDGFDVGDNNTFTNSGTFGSATCARGGNRALANYSAGFRIGSNNTFLPADGPATPSIANSPVHFAWCNGSAENNVDGNGVVISGDGNKVRNVSAINNKYNGFFNPPGSDNNELAYNVASNFTRPAPPAPDDISGAKCTPAGHPASAPTLLTTDLPGGLSSFDQNNGWENNGANSTTPPALPNRAWRNTFGDIDFENSTNLGATYDGNVDYGILIGGNARTVLEESIGQVGATAAADLNANGKIGEACNVITNNGRIGLYNLSSGARQQIDDADGQGGTRLSNIYEQIGTAVDIEHDGTGTLKAEGLWTLVTVGPTPDIDVGPSTGIVQVSSTRVHTRTTVSQLLIDCAGDSGASPPTPPTPGPSNILGDVNGNSSFEQDDVNELLNALRNRASWLTDPSDSKFQVSDVARPCGKITRADYNRLRSSWLRVQKGRSALKSQCGSKGTIGFDPASAPRLLTVLSGQAGAAGVRVAVYDFAGRLLLEQKATGAQVALDLVQRELANGVYLAVVESLAADGRTLVREVRKVIVLR
jgi:hypothetical protein